MKEGLHKDNTFWLSLDKYGELEEGNNVSFCNNYTERARNAALFTHVTHYDVRPGVPCCYSLWCPARCSLLLLTMVSGQVFLVATHYDVRPGVPCCYSLWCPARCSVLLLTMMSDHVFVVATHYGVRPGVPCCYLPSSTAYCNKDMHNRIREKYVESECKRAWTYNNLVGSF